ncbi:MAG: AEC family transporter [Xanthomonadales bacterium]|nr:AEC family transporter [Xanthomonadales bacterium]
MLAEQAAEPLAAIVVRLCLPAAVLLHVPGLALGPAPLAVAAVPWLLLAASLALVELAIRLWPALAAARAVLWLLVPLGNTSFLGYPLVEALCGPEALPYAVIYDQFGSFLIVSSFGTWVLARHRGGAPPGGRALLRAILRFPPFLALLLALLLPGPLPPVLAQPLERLAACILPLAALTVALRLRLRLPAADRPVLVLGLLLKLLALPALALLLAPLLGLAGPAREAAVLEAAMPPMITAAALAAEARLRPELAAALVGYGLVAAVLTLPAWAWLLRLTAG